MFILFLFLRAQQLIATINRRLQAFVLATEEKYLLILDLEALGLRGRPLFLFFILLDQNLALEFLMGEDSGQFLGVSGYCEHWKD